MLKINELTYTIENITILKNLNIQIEKNKIITLLAPFGSGKSTLLNLICSKIIDNNNIKCKEKIFYIPSVPIAIEGYSAAQNIKFYNKLIKDDEINLLLDKVGLSGYGSHIPQLINSGFLFRLTVAIGLSLGAKIFLLDDSLNDMKNNSKMEILDFLRFLLQNNDISIFFATSNFIDAILVSDKIYIAKAQPMEVIFEKEIINSSFSLIDKLTDINFNNSRIDIEQEIKKHNLSNLII